MKPCWGTVRDMVNENGEWIMYVGLFIEDVI